ncbi:hypothetical protein K7X08_033043 [Anisodus acutangulus]|uniref:Uncharacterized protein n=1 Tax=Anisodus acutangulus TaxID=402998 RepID=A0A9Q1M3H4_9SOLA|nr:hypothetical protein K7X08_033043 [Anisodus acutangulus]
MFPRSNWNIEVGNLCLVVVCYSNSSRRVSLYHGIIFPPYFNSNNSSQRQRGLGSSTLAWQIELADRAAVSEQP